MSAVTTYEARVLDQEIDAIEICPAFPEYVVVGTYSLVKRSDSESGVDNTEEAAREGEASHTAQSRVGSIQILPFGTLRTIVHQDQYQFETVRQDFSCAILDLHFCPTDNTLLAASTSIGELRFFRINSLSNPSRLSVMPTSLLSIGIVKIYQESSDESEVSPPLITQFAWAGSHQDPDDRAKSHKDTTHFLATSDTTGQTTLIEVRLPCLSESAPKYHVGHDEILPLRYGHVHKHLHNLEAWTISTVTLFGTSNTQRQMLLSGGDDSCLIVSTYTRGLVGTHFTAEMAADSIVFDVPPTRIHLDKRTHGAGVVSIFPLPSISTPILGSELTTMIPVLTGSYDQHLRLFLYDPNTLKFQLKSELELEGGVWRIALLDSYSSGTKGRESKKDYILLISAMHAGCYIIRLSWALQAERSEESWWFSIECRFTKPHESMVYACAARKVSDCGNGGERVWEVISTSFYDKRICVWQWIDRGEKVVEAQAKTVEEEDT